MAQEAAVPSARPKEDSHGVCVVVTGIKVKSVRVEGLWLGGWVGGGVLAWRKAGLLKSSR